MLSAPIAALLGLFLSAPTGSRSISRLLPGPAPQDFSLSRQEVAPLFAARSVALSSRIDTLEIHVFLVQFKKESPDKKNTTGDGTFGSDSAVKYALEPASNRAKRPREHFDQIFAFQKRYWSEVSRGRLVLEFRIFPTGDSLFYTLDSEMDRYRPAEATGGVKPSQFDSTLDLRFMEFVAHASRKAATDAAGPFAQAPSASGTRHRGYLLVHAGADPLNDGGKLGRTEANSKSDLSSAFVDAPFFDVFKYGLFKDDRRRTMDSSLFRDTLGIVLEKPGADTLTQLMVLSETASQDGLTGGQHGLLSNQIGRFIGLPDTYDWNQGLSVMGRFCGMDLGGFLLPGSGFLPVRPSAWLRLYMGWATPVVATPSGPRRFRLPPVGAGRDSVLVIPLDDGEYLLVENRQRADALGRVKIRTGTLEGTPDVVVDVSPDSVEHLFLDSLNKLPNPRRLKGYVLDASPDAGMPGSGLLVWKVNEWLLRSALLYGGPNRWRGELMRDRYRGISLVEADGISTLGVVFTNAVGQTTQDFGSGADLLPHVKKSSSRRDTVSAIGPMAYSSTKNLADGRSLVTLRAAWPTPTRPEGGTSEPARDSVYTTGGDQTLELSLDWGPYRDTLARFPVRISPAWGEASLLPGPVAGSLWHLDTAGRTQLLLSDGSPAFASRDTLKVSQAWDGVPSTVPTAGDLDSLELPLQSVGPALGKPLGSALLGDTLVVRTPAGLHLRALSGGIPVMAADTAIVSDVFHPGSFQAGPLVLGDRAWVASGDSLHGFGSDGSVRSRRLPFAPQDLAEMRRAGSPFVVAAGPSARVALLNLQTDSVSTLGSSLDPVEGETFRVAVADFDRDGLEDAFVLGSRGSALMAGPAGMLPGWPRRFDRGQSTAPETSPAALADLDRDGFPEAIFSGNDKVFVVGRSGAPLPGWPTRISRTESVGQAAASLDRDSFAVFSDRWPAGFVGSSPLVADLDGDGRAEVLAGLPDARIAAWDARGSAYRGILQGATSGTGASPVYTQSRWPLAAGGRVGDSTRPPVLHIALVPARGSEPPRLHALSSLSTLDAFRLVGATSSWNLPAGDARRSARLSDTGLSTPSQGSKEIAGFHIFPSPVRAKSGTFRWNLGRSARKATITVFDQTGYAILSRSDLCTARGTCDLPLSDLRWGTGVYAARLEVEWSEGGSAESWTRFGVVR
jgi:hypothetical protein